VVFHDGEPFNAEAAKTAIERTLDERIDCEIRIKFFGGMQVTPVVVDEHTLDVKTAEPAPILPTMMGTMTMTSPNTVTGERTRDPIGTGPYRFVSWTPGTSVVLERFEGYWGEQPEVEQVTYVFRGESAVRAAMVATGEADIAPTSRSRTQPTRRWTSATSTPRPRASGSTSTSRRSTTCACARP
jgi:peptide/nickel transport system substrate-binding protein